MAVVGTSTLFFLYEWGLGQTIYCGLVAFDCLFISYRSINAENEPPRTGFKVEKQQW